MERELRFRNYSERSISTYVRCVGQVSNHFNLPPGKITIDQVKDFLYHIIEKEHCSTSKINQIISGWKILQEDILKRKWDGIRIKRPRREKRLPVILSRKEALRLIDAPSNLKHRTAITLLYSTGIRRNELISIALKDIDRSRKVIKINGKGNKQREVPLSEKQFFLIESSYKKYKPLLFLFEGYVPGEKYSESSIEKIVKDSAKKAGIKKSIAPHILRHTFATHMIEKGVNLKRLQLLMGHSSIKTTSIYLHLANVDNVILPDLTNDSDIADGKA